MLVGRKTEQAALRAIAERSQQGHGTALLLAGEPGIGKTMLLDDLEREQRTAMTILRAAGGESTADLPFMALKALLLPVEKHFGALPAPQEKALRLALGLDEPGVGVDRLSVPVAVRGVLGRAAGRRPVLAIVDDAQWLDEPSRSTLLFVARQLQDAQIAMVIACRSGELPEPETRGLPRLELQGLRGRDAQAVLDATARTPVATAVRRRLLELAAGNPLALAELPRALSAGQLAGAEPLGEPVPVNGGVERAFGTRIARLPERSRRALLLLAAAGEDATDTVAAGLRREGLEPADLEPAETAGLVSKNGAGWTFRHPLVRSVAYFQQPTEERRAAHAALASSERSPDRRAWHRAAAAGQADDEVAAALEETARRALARGAPGSAATALEAAARLSTDEPSCGLRLTGAARAAHRAGDVLRAERLSREARALTSDPIAIADLLLVDADLRMRSGDLEGAHDALTAHADRLLDVDRRRAATMLLLAAKLRIYKLEAAAAADEVDRARAVLPEGEHDLVHLVAVSMSQTAAGRKGARDAALAAASAAAKAPHGHAHTLGIAWPLIWLEEYDAAREVAVRALAIQREAGFLLYVPQSLLPLAELDFRTGRWETAIAAAREALDLFRETLQPTEAASAAAVLARMEAARGKADACRALAQIALAGDVEFGLRSSSAQALGALGLLALGARQPEDAVAPLGTAERMARRGAVGEPWLLMSSPDLVEALVHVGQSVRATEVLSELEEQSDALGRVSASAAAARCRGILGDMDAFERALVLHDRVPTPFERARTELCYGESLRRSKRRSEARERLRSCLTTFEELGATPWAERARAELQASGERARRRTAPLDTLTAQERVVALLVGDGLKNREAATRLFVSEKTIEYHLANVYRKLGVRSRVGLARLLG